MDVVHYGQWERLSSVIGWTGLSTHSFAYSLGLKRSENLYRIKNKKNGISRKLVGRILEVYPDISDTWLMTGIGTMLKSSDYVNVIDIPYYAEGVAQFIDMPDRCNSRYVIPMTYEAEIAVDVEDSIIPDIIPSGTVALLKRVEKNKIVYGKPYYIVTEFFNEFCLVEKSSVANEIILRGDIKEVVEEPVPLAKKRGRRRKDADMGNESLEYEKVDRIGRFKKIGKKESEEVVEREDENYTSIGLSSVNYVFSVGGYVKKL